MGLKSHRITRLYAGQARLAAQAPTANYSPNRCYCRCLRRSATGQTAAYMSALGADIFSDPSPPVNSLLAESCVNCESADQRFRLSYC